MSVNIRPFSLDRTLSDVGGSVRGQVLQHHLQPDQPGSVGRCSCSLRTNEPGFSKSIFSSQITGNEVLILF